MNIIIDGIEFDITKFINLKELSLPYGVIAKIDNNGQLQSFTSTNTAVSIEDLCIGNHLPDNIDDITFNVNIYGYNLIYDIDDEGLLISIGIEKDIFTVKTNNNIYSLCSDQIIADYQLGKGRDLGDSTYYWTNNNDFEKVVTYERNCHSVLVWGNFKFISLPIGEIIDKDKVIQNKYFKAMNDLCVELSINNVRVYVHYQTVNSTKIHIHGVELLYSLREE